MRLIREVKPCTSCGWDGKFHLDVDGDPWCWICFDRFVEE